MAQVMIIADDFTGALDTGVKFAMKGAKTLVLIPQKEAWEIFPDCDVIVIDAETRHMSAELAGKKVENIAGYALTRGVSIIYKKTDSALRGNVGAELSALWRAGGQGQLHFLPAMPQMGRITKNGIQMIDGVPVSQSVFGTDPFEPVMDSSVVRLIAEQSDVPVFSCSAIDEKDITFDEAGIIVYDADSVEDLFNIGRYLQSKGKLKILAGCAGFAACLSELLDMQGFEITDIPYHDSCITVVCGSVNPITVKQLDKAEKAGFVRLRLTPRQELEKGYWGTDEGKRDLYAIRKTLCKFPLCIIDSNNQGNDKATMKYAKKNGIGWEDVRIRVSKSVGDLLKNIFNMPEIGTLLVTGGDTLLQCMESIGIYEVEPITELSPGVVLFRFMQDERARYVISKSGGIGEEDLIVELIGKLIRGEIKNVKEI